METIIKLYVCALLIYAALYPALCIYMCWYKHYGTPPLHALKKTTTNNTPETTNHDYEHYRTKPNRSFDGAA